MCPYRTRSLNISHCLPLIIPSSPLWRHEMLIEVIAVLLCGQYDLPRLQTWLRLLVLIIRQFHNRITVLSMRLLRSLDLHRLGLAQFFIAAPQYLFLRWGWWCGGRRKTRSLLRPPGLALLGGPGAPRRKVGSCARRGCCRCGGRRLRGRRGCFGRGLGGRCGCFGCDLCSY